MGCFLALVISLKLILRRMLPLMLLISGLIRPLWSASSATFSFSVRGLTMGGLAWVLAPALNVRSSKKFSRSAANLRSALSKSKSGGNPSGPTKPSPSGFKKAAAPIPPPLIPLVPLFTVVPLEPLVVPPLMLGAASGRMVALLRLLVVFPFPSASSAIRPSPEMDGEMENLDNVDRRLAEL